MRVVTAWKVLLCGALMLGAPLIAGAQTVTKVLISPKVMPLDAGRSRRFTLQLLNASSQEVSPDGVPIAFTSSDSTIATVASDGTVTGLKAGSVDIVVKAGSASNKASVFVSGTAAAAQPVRPTPAPAGPAPVGASIQPINIQLLQGERVRPTLRLLYADGNQLETRDVVWSVLGTSIFYDANTNEVVGVEPGRGTLVGKHGTFTTPVPVTVGEAQLATDPDSVVVVEGATDTVSVLVLSQGRRQVTQNLTWRSSEPTILRVLNPTAGIVQAGSAGNTTLIVEGYGDRRTLPVRVMPRTARVSTTVEAGTPILLGTSSTLGLEAKPYATDGSLLSAATITWQLTDSSIARIDRSGVIVGLRPGTTRLTLDAPGHPTMAWPVTVQPARVSFDADVTSLVAGTSRKLMVRLRGADQRDFGAAPSARVSYSAPGVATVDSSGRVNAVAPGRATLIVTQPGAGADTMTVFVTGRVLVSGSIAGVRGLWQLVGADDSVRTELYRPDSGVVTQAVWSPDRTRIAATVELGEKASRSRVVLLDADGRNLSLLSPDSLNVGDPSWTLDGTAVLVASRDQKTSGILRIGVTNRDVSLLLSSPSIKLRFPTAGPDSVSVLVRHEANGPVDIAQIKGGAAVLLTEGKPREELVARLPRGRLLLAVDSSGGRRPSTLQWVTVGADQLQTPTAVRVPANLVFLDIGAGPDDGSVLAVARARSWPGESGTVILVLRLPLDGSDWKVLMILNEKDAVTVRTQ